jgi:hypothetical protein
MEPNNEKKTLTDISVSGTYKLKLFPMKFGKFYPDTDFETKQPNGAIYYMVHFQDDKGNCLNKRFTSKSPKALNLLRAKFNGGWAEDKDLLRMDCSEAEFIEFMRPAFLQTCLIGVEVTPNGVSASGRARYKYSLTYPKGSQKPVVNDRPAIDDAAPPF